MLGGIGFGGDACVGEPDAWEGYDLEAQSSEDLRAGGRLFLTQLRASFQCLEVLRRNSVLRDSVVP
jgi:hypothetical protein